MGVKLEELRLKANRSMKFADREAYFKEKDRGKAAGNKVKNVKKARRLGQSLSSRQHSFEFTGCKELCDQGQCLRVFNLLRYLITAVVIEESGE